MDNNDNINNINLNLFRYFIASVESNSFAEAGEKLGYSATNVSTSVSTLEKQLGVQLFTRKPLKPTDLGMEIYEAVKKGLGNFDFAYVLAQSKNDLEYGKISIGCPSHITDFFLMERIADAIKDYPNLQVNLDTESGSKELIQSLKDNKIDFIVLDTVPDEYKKDIEIKEIKEIEYIFVSREKIDIKDIKELENYKYILTYDNRVSNIKLFEVLKEKDVSITPILRCPTTEQRVNAARLGIGIAYVMKDAVQDELYKKELYEVKIPIKLPRNDLKIVYLKNHLTRVDRQFINNYLMK